MCKIIILGCIFVTTNCCDLLFTLFKRLDRARWFDRFHKHSRIQDASGLVWMQMLSSSKDIWKSFWHQIIVDPTMRMRGQLQKRFLFNIDVARMWDVTSLIQLNVQIKRLRYLVRVPVPALVLVSVKQGSTIEEIPDQEECWVCC